MAASTGKGGGIENLLGKTGRHRNTTAGIRKGLGIEKSLRLCLWRIGSRHGGFHGAQDFLVHTCVTRKS
jgi:hypothetical protein